MSTEGEAVNVSGLEDGRHDLLLGLVGLLELLVLIVLSEFFLQHLLFEELLRVHVLRLGGAVRRGRGG